MRIILPIIRLLIILPFIVNAVYNLAICVIDKMLHMSLVFALLILAAAILNLQHREYKREGYNDIKFIFRSERFYLYGAITCLVAFVTLTIASVTVSAKWFQSQEFINGCVGFACVQFTPMDMMLISNGREFITSSATTALRPEIYIADRRQGLDALCRSYQQQFGDNVKYTKLENVDAYIYYRSEQILSGDQIATEDIAAFIMVETRGLYEILVVAPSLEFARKDLLGLSTNLWQRRRI